MPNNRPDPSYYETSANDPRPIVDLELEDEADKSGRIHVRKSTKGSQVLPGYGTKNFGVSSFVPLKKTNLSRGSLLASAGLGAVSYLGWNFRSNISTGLGVLANYALLMKESMMSAREE